MKYNDKVSFEELIALFSYDKYTGKFTRLVTTGPRGVKGTVAGGICKGYCVIKINKVPYKAHRLAWLYEYGEWPDDQLDHKNRNKLDNRIDNLELANNRQNCSNKDNNSEFIGTSYVPNINSLNPWISRIQFKGNAIHLGYYSSAELASKAYQEALIDINMNITPNIVNIKGRVNESIV
jgi:hypothetical protein